jgi:pimeloyl-ACP methyl ester carboxylesterase
MKKSSKFPLKHAKGEQMYEYSPDHAIRFSGDQRSRCAAAVICLSGVGLLYHSYATVRDRLRHPPPGRLLDAGGCRLHLHVAGAGSPTVVLEAGLGGMSSVWAWVQPEIAKFSTVVSYDRAGLGWSDADSTPPTAKQVAVRLRALLQGAAASPPFILVGHSMGGLFIRVFADLFPNEVVGLVFVDASHPDQHRRSAAIDNHMQSGFRMLKGVPLLAGIGFVRLTGLFNSWSDGLPEKQAAEAVAFLSTYKHLKTARDESLAWDTICAEVLSTRRLGDKPLAVVTAGKDVLPGQPELQGELAALSSKSIHLAVKGATHVSLVTHRQYAESVVEAIRHVFQAWRGAR